MKSKLKLIIWPLIYLVLIINVCISFLFVFRSYYFKSIFVSGSSMEPTLNGNSAGFVDYGLIDDHKKAIDDIKRFQIITCYYPFADSHDYVGGYKHGKENTVNMDEASYKIKRVYALPNETIKFEVDEDLYNKAISYADPYCEEAQKYAQEALSVLVKKNGDLSFVKQEINFKRKIKISRMMDYANFEEYEHKDGEYWVMGDNYSASSDCFNKKEPIFYDNIVGVLISINGTCKITTKVDENDDGTKISYRCKDRKIHWPKYYY